MVIYNSEIEIIQMMKAMEDPARYNKEEARYRGYLLIYQNCVIKSSEAIKRYYEGRVI